METPTRTILSICVSIGLVIRFDARPPAAGRLAEHITESHNQYVTRYSLLRHVPQAVLQGGRGEGEGEGLGFHSSVRQTSTTRRSAAAKQRLAREQEMQEMDKPLGLGGREGGHSPTHWRWREALVRCLSGLVSSIRSSCQS